MINKIHKHINVYEGENENRIKCVVNYGHKLFFRDIQDVENKKSTPIYT